MLRSYEGHIPRVPLSAWVDETALVIGDVILGADASVWPMAVLRGDVNAIRVGAASNIQDGSVLHVTHDGPYSPGGLALEVGHEVTVGHRAVLHACRIRDRVLIGMGSVVMDGAEIGADTILAAGSLVPPGKTLEGGYLWQGSPAQQVRPLTDGERDQLRYSAQHYVQLKDRHAGLAVPLDYLQV
ncbi:gamma carbonic anhydrase family protein [Ectothiorhodospira mobilis]|uniref:gamma carbonic anhydrase family protein n=1 Tax=Ectothiorhodospira mobilis TaxID=195064 RepID=UPI0019071D31|nr:gamma carbonic anhydrase family protein [Ectothiorhodospira mobilis]MBK1692057.1 gamma carbonic anhydrase family protein [Ectothiorhodospira mobilis]